MRTPLLRAIQRLYKEARRQQAGLPPIAPPDGPSLCLLVRSAARARSTTVPGSPTDESLALTCHGMTTPSSDTPPSSHIFVTHFIDFPPKREGNYARATCRRVLTSSTSLRGEIGFDK